MKKERQNARKTNPYYGSLLGILIVLFLNGLVFPRFGKGRIVTTDYGNFIALVDSGRVKDVMIKSNQIFFTAQDGNGEIRTYQTGEINDPKLVDRLLEAKSPNADGNDVGIAGTYLLSDLETGQ